MNRLALARNLGCSLLAFGGITAVFAAESTNQILSAVPKGYWLQAYDDCGVENRQPHVLMQDAFFFSFATSDTDAGPKERSAVFSTKAIQALYTNLDPKLSYVLALTYASDHVYHRVQSLEANGVLLHGPYALPNAKATRVVVRVPEAVARDGRMTLTWRQQGEANITVSIIELWANAPPTNSFRISELAGLPASLEGQLLDLAWDPVVGAEITLSAPGNPRFLTTNTGPKGTFSFGRRAVEDLGKGVNLTLKSKRGAEHGRSELSGKDLFFEPVHYRPLPAWTDGLATNCVLLDGMWAANPVPGPDFRTRPLTGAGWVPFKVPGQWLQQGLDVPQDKVVVVAREFDLPEAWAEKRLILRFDAIHAGTSYWLNGQKLGYSENLFTPVEWDITAATLPGRANRLMLEMKVATISEALSYSSGYAFHNLGGIDRSVRAIALPLTHISQLHLDAQLDPDYRDGNLRLDLLLDSGAQFEKDLSLALQLRDPRGKKTPLSVSTAKVGPFTGTKSVQVTAHVVKPQPWSAEEPALYHLRLELRRNGIAVERIERNIGFRKVEIRGRQLYVNGRRIKIAGACHHETDPLTGRADTARHAETDVRQLKEANLNWIRTSHYPPTAELLDAADRFGMYVEVEAPFCWVGHPAENPDYLRAILGPTSAMIDYDRSHPSVIIWSIANESEFNPYFFHATRMCKELDPTRPTTFNNPDLDGTPMGGITDIANTHYPAWPYEGDFAQDARPLYLGEYFFEVTHEQTDVRIDPGLRELWGQGQAEPDSIFSRRCALEYDKPVLKPGLKPGGWSDIYHSDHVAGGSIWAALDDAFYFSESRHAGYAWHHGFWGLIDSWRRPKPEWYLARHVFSPVWLETRHADFVSGQRMLRLPVENRYSFTDFSRLGFTWDIGGQRGHIKPHLAPGARGQLEIPVPAGTAEGSQLHLRVSDRAGAVVHESTVWLGKEKPALLPRPGSGAPHWSQEGNKILIRGVSFGLVFDKAKGDFASSDPRHNCAVISFPTIHTTRYDFGDLNGPDSPPYAVLPDSKSRVFDRIEVKEETSGLRLTVYDHYEDFAGWTSWLLDQHGRGVVGSDYRYSGKPTDTREAGIRMLLRADYDEVHWQRWSEYGIFPEESISRCEGSAKAHRETAWGPARWDRTPPWPWSLDETEMGTADFRAVKFNVYKAMLVAPSGAALILHADADAHFRAALAPEGVAAHLLWRCPLGQVPLKPGDRLHGEFVVQMRP